MYSGKELLRHQNSRIKASFGIDGILCSFSGTISDEAPSFKCSAVSLAYSAITQMTGRKRSFKGVFGPNDVQITIDNGVVVSGKLDGSIDGATLVSGKCSWVQI